jgi:predicted amidohydrolase
MRLAAFQMVAVPGDVDANFALIAEAAAAARAKGAELVVAPELAVTGYGAEEAIRALAEPAEGSHTARLAAIAAEQAIAIVAGFAERAGDRLYNSAAMVTPEGLAAVYRKCHLWGDYERALFAPGDRPPRALDFRGMRLGLLICYDAEFPEAARHLAAEGAELILVPTAQPEGASAAVIAEKIVPTRAFENGIAIVYADHAGADRRFAYAGRSCIVMPDAHDGARAGRTAAEVIVADYEPTAYAAARAENPYLRDRRVDLFR